MNPSKQFNADVAFIYGSVWKTEWATLSTTYKVGGGISTRARDKYIVDAQYIGTTYSLIPNFASLTDWNRRITPLPTLSKTVDHWTGNFEISSVDFALADTDGSVYNMLYENGRPFGTAAMMLQRVSQNPSYWLPVFVGNVSKVVRTLGKTTVTLDDNARNIYNSQFVPYYLPLATTIRGVLYGTVKDVMGSNVYVDDMGDVQIVQVVNETGGDFWGMLLGVTLGAGLGFLTGGLALPAAWGAMGAGAAAGALSNLPQTQSYTESYYKVTDFNVIPDNTILGGKTLKFYPSFTVGSMPACESPLYSVTGMRVRGGKFEFGIYGTLEMDDPFHNIQKGDYVYSELPVAFSGDPADIIKSMLTGPNSSIRYNYPDDFAGNWNTGAAPLRHIELSAQITEFEEGGVMNAIQNLAQEIGFTFVINEENKFSIRSLQEADLSTSAIVATIADNYNIIGDGLTRTDDIKLAYTDLEISYKPLFAQMYEQTIKIPISGGTLYNGQKRVRRIQSKWITDSITAEFIATRMIRRLGTIAPRISGQLPLYSVPIQIGDIIHVTSALVGTSRPYEIISYSKDYDAGITEFEADAAELMYGKRAFGYLASVAEGAIGTSSLAGFGTILLSNSDSPGNAGTLIGTVYESDNVMTLWSPKDAPAPTYLSGSYFRIGQKEVMYAYSYFQRGTTISGNAYDVREYKIERGCFNTVPESYVQGQYPVVVWPPTATTFGISESIGTYFRWY